MATEPKIKIEFESDATQITVTEITGAHTINNEGGHGSPNPERSDVASVLLAYYQPYDEDKELIIEESDIIRFDAGYTNNEESQWVIPYGKDGWYQFLLVIVPQSIAPADGRIIYSVADGELKQYNESLQLVEVYDLSKLDNPAIYPLIKENCLPLPILKAYKNKRAKDFFIESANGSCEFGQEFKEILELGQSIQSTINYFLISPMQSQKTVELLTKKYKL